MPLFAFDAGHCGETEKISITVNIRLHVRPRKAGYPYNVSFRSLSPLNSLVLDGLGCAVQMHLVEPAQFLHEVVRFDHWAVLHVVNGKVDLAWRAFAASLF